MSGAEDERKKRLAQALRDNLRRRKAQSRATEPGGRDGTPRRDEDDPA